MVVLYPDWGGRQYDRNKMLVDGVVVDYQRQSSQLFHMLPAYKPWRRIAGWELGASVTIYGTVFDQDSDDLSYTWSSSGGTIQGRRRRDLASPLIREGTS